jgi:dCTP deaminase
MVKNDQWIFEQDDLIHPISNKVSEGLSYGIGSYGYDIRLSPKDFKVFKDTNDVIDPLSFNPNLLKQLNLDLQYPDSFVLKPFTAALGVSIERFKIPNNVSALVIGKSTYARCGLILNTTPLEPGWEGHITLEFFNTTGSSIRLRTNQGIAQVLFFEGDPCWQTYNGKYQNQKHQVTLPR